jgi:hypothetical protein
MNKLASIGFGVFIVLNGVDYYLTKRILKYGGKELNPVINKIGIIPSKTIAVGAAGLMGYFVSWGVFVPLNIIMVGCCVWNYVQIKRYIKRT